MISIILTVFNKEWLIADVIRAIQENISQTTKEIIFVVDGCTDKSDRVIKSCIPQTHSYGVKILYADNVFETKANNIGLKAATQPYCMIIQDDMVIQEKDFDLKLLKPFSNFTDVFAVSARTAHDNTIINGLLEHVNIIGKESNLEKGIFAIRDSCNRGPLLLRHDILKNVGYLDEQFAPQGLDDHDICMRVYKEYGLVSGAYMIDYRSDIEWGSSRGSSKYIIHKAWMKNAQIMMSRHHDALLGEKHGELRICL